MAAATVAASTVAPVTPTKARSSSLTEKFKGWGRKLSASSSKEKLASPVKEKSKETKPVTKAKTNGDAVVSKDSEKPTTEMNGDSSVVAKDDKLPTGGITALDAEKMPLYPRMSRLLVVLMPMILRTSQLDLLQEKNKRMIPKLVTMNHMKSNQFMKLFLIVNSKLIRMIQITLKSVLKISKPIRIWKIKFNF